MGLGLPCDVLDMDLFYALTSITIGDGRTVAFWQSPWLMGHIPKDNVPAIFKLSKRKNFYFHKGLSLDNCINNINIGSITSILHIIEFTDLWAILQDVQLIDTLPDDITWILTPSREYLPARPTGHNLKERSTPS